MAADLDSYLLSEAVKNVAVPLGSMVTRLSGSVYGVSLNIAQYRGPILAEMVTRPTRFFDS